VVMDPKFDEWMPFAMAQEANAAGVPFVLMDLRKDWPQINLLAGASAADVEELLVAGLGLSDKGGEGDFYRVSDRRAAASLAQAILAANSRATLADLAEAAQADDGLVKNAAGLVGRLAEIAATPALSAYAGPDLAATLAAGGVVYILGSMRHGRILAAQRMILVRLMQIIEQRPRDDDAPPARRVCIFLDELKAHISRPALEMLGAIRDKGAHLIVAHQAVADLRDVPADLDKEAVVGAIVENCAIRVVYRIQDPATRTWIASMSGKILVDDETRQVETSAALVERQSGNRSLRQTDRFKIDENQLAALPDGVAVVFVGTTTQFAHICAIPTKKTGLRIVRGKPRPEPIAVPAGGADGGQVDDWKVTKGGDE